MEVEVSETFKQAALALACKRTMLRASLQDISTLVLGSSHGDFGFDPGHCPGSFNLCSRSQDFSHSHAIYRRVAHSLPRLQTVVLFYSVFSPGHVLEKSPGEREVGLAIHEILDLDLAYSDLDLACRAGALKHRLANWAPTVDGRLGFLPTLQKSFFPENYGADRRAQEHLKLNRGHEALPDLAATAVLAQSLGHRLLVVVPPARADYRAACATPPPTLFRGLEEMRPQLALSAFAVLNFWDDPDFTDSGFGDFDHLLPLGAGAATLSRKVSIALNRQSPSG